jgi:hypothetical protein
MKIIYEMSHRPLLKRLEQKGNANPKTHKCKNIINLSCIRSGNGLGNLGDLHAGADDALT